MWPSGGSAETGTRSIDRPAAMTVRTVPPRKTFSCPAPYGAGWNGPVVAGVASSNENPVTSSPASIRV